MKVFAVLLALTLVVALMVMPVSGKGVADRIAITGPGLDQAAEVGDTEILERFNPWAGHFLGSGGSLEYPPYVGQRIPYEVKFFTEDSPGEQVLRYFFYYFPDPAGGRGSIYLPGPDEPFYSVNAGTIMRGKADGRWHYALPGWDRVVGDILADGGVAAGYQGVLTSLDWPLLGLVALLVSGGMFWAGRLSKRI